MTTNKTQPSFAECKAALLRCGPGRPWAQFSWSCDDAYRAEVRSARSWYALYLSMRGASQIPGDVRATVARKAAL